MNPPNFSTHCLISNNTFTITDQLKESVKQNQYALAQAGSFKLNKTEQIAFYKLQNCWQHLERDSFYVQKNSTCYRLRRYSDFDFNPRTGELRPRSHIPYFQSIEMNRYVGGKVRHFGDVLADTYENPFFQDLVTYDFSLFPVEEKFLDHLWICQIHMIRIVVGSNQSTPITPEGIHSDGYPFAGVHLINRNNVEGGESTVYTYDERPLATLTFENPLDSLWLEDRKLKHYVTPIKSIHGHIGSRDVLAISFSLPDSSYTTHV
ncbi:MAG: 2OG-Fe dioxygenase family protein [Dolichospermum sp. DL01]|nr:MAG: 2OG-Fe dioxygenase family protein [Dolichospermum sp. DL01]